MKRKVLITGGSGFIGSAVKSALEFEGHDVAGYDRRNGHDILDRERLMRVFKGFDSVIHLAGILGTDELFDNPYDAVEANVTGTLNVLDACVENGLSYVGITMPQVFPSIYTATKICATKLATAYHHAHGLPVCHVRAYNVFGPGQAHGPGHPRKIVPAFACEGWANKPLGIWGDGNQTVDLISTNELAKIFVDALDVYDDTIIDGGTGFEWTVNDVAIYTIQRTGSTAGTIHHPMRRGEIPTQIVATGEGWPRLSEIPRFHLEELNYAIDSYKDHPLAK